MSTSAQPPTPPYQGGAASADTPARRDRRVAIGIVVGALVVLVSAVLWFTRSPGPPSAPVALQATGRSCDSPCETISSSVTLEWTPPESGAEATGYRVLRDDVALDADLAGSDLSFVDDEVGIGGSYEYRVLAMSDEGESPPSAPVIASVPLPPDGAAHLHGVYRVELSVRRARSIGAAFGIDDPLPGKRGRDRWSFESSCEPNDGACPSTWSGLQGDIDPRRGRWTGTVDGLPARCGRDGRAPAPIDLDLLTVDVDVVDDAWVVTGFRGTATVAFRCPGFPTASATVEVTGAL
jgi:hypothetical protein